MFGSGYDSNIHMLVRDTLFQRTFAFSLSGVQESCCYGREVLELPFWTLSLSILNTLNPQPTSSISLVFGFFTYCSCELMPNLLHIHSTAVASTHTAHTSTTTARWSRRHFRLASGDYIVYLQ